MKTAKHIRLAAALSLAVAIAQSQTPQAICQAPSASAIAAEGYPLGIRVVFSDFECFPCACSASVVAGVLEQNRDVRLIFKHAPAATNPNAFLAHEAALAAGAQGRFWEMHYTLFENQTKLSRADLLAYAKTLNLNLAVFQQALDNHTSAQNRTGPDWRHEEIRRRNLPNAGGGLLAGTQAAGHSVCASDGFNSIGWVQQHRMGSTASDGFNSIGWVQQLMDGSVPINPEPGDYVRASTLILNFQDQSPSSTPWWQP